MTLQEHIDEIRNDLRNEAFINEASVSQGIVLRLLHALGWPWYNTQVVIPEYSVEGGRVDFALCHPASRPLVFIEVKRLGQIEGAERQLFEYALQGVPIAILILTDGQEWRFFHPIAPGDYRERLVYQLDLIEPDNGESAERLNRYLSYYLIRNDKATQAIADDHRRISSRRYIEEVWSGLSEDQRRCIEEARSELLEQESRLVGLVENQWDRPVDEQVLDFLKSLETDPPPTPPPPTPGPRQTCLDVTMPNGENIKHHEAVATFAEVIEKLGIEEVRRVYPYLVSTSQSPQYNRQVGEYYVRTQSSTQVKKRQLERVAEKLGIQLTVDIVPRESN